MNKLKKLDSNYFISKNYFGNDGTQNNLVFQPIDKCLKFNPKTGLLSEWKSKGLSDKIIIPSNTSLGPTRGFEINGKRYLTFKGNCLKNDELKINLTKL